MHPYCRIWLKTRLIAYLFWSIKWTSGICLGDKCQTPFILLFMGRWIDQGRTVVAHATKPCVRVWEFVWFCGISQSLLSVFNLAHLHSSRFLSVDELDFYLCSARRQRAKNHRFSSGCFARDRGIQILLGKTTFIYVGGINIERPLFPSVWCF